MPRMRYREESMCSLSRRRSGTGRVRQLVITSSNPRNSSSLRLGYLADASISYSRDDIPPQLLIALADGVFALALELVPGPFDRGQLFDTCRSPESLSRRCWRGIAQLRRPNNR